MILLDSNVVIYAAKPAYAAVRAWLATQPSGAVSAVSRVEVLGFPSITQGEEANLRAFLAAVPQYPVSDVILDRAVDLRQQRRMSLGDSLIAATAVVRGLPLATANTADFRGVPGLVLLDPFAP